MGRWVGGWMDEGGWVRMSRRGWRVDGWMVVLVGGWLAGWLTGYMDR